MANTLHLIIAILLALFIGVIIGIMIAQMYIIPKPQLVMGCYNTSNLTILADFVRNVS